MTGKALFEFARSKMEGKEISQQAKEETFVLKPKEEHPMSMTAKLVQRPC